MNGTAAFSEFGVHRSIEPVGVLPQEAWRLDNHPRLWPCEARLDVDVLALDPAVFRRLRDEMEGHPGKMRARVLETVAERSKFQDPSTGAAGSLLGRVSEIGAGHPQGLRVGARVALPSALGLTPLWLADIAAWDGTSALVPARGHAIVFPRSPLAGVPRDADARLALSVIEATAVVTAVGRRLRPGDKVAVLGAAHPAGALACVAALARGASRVLAVVESWQEACLVEALGAATPTVADLGDPLATATAACEGLEGLSDLAVVCRDVKGVETAGLLSTRPGGTTLFATCSLSCGSLADLARSLNCEGELLIAGDQSSDAAEDAFELLTAYPALRAVLDQ
ncbi:MAG: zinc-binding alcohol dehydrogenase, partial [Actinomycetota bacterium]|nr:zinc-binding alcohol dehydrogenase [Actinomycetota bacterium]